MSLFWLCLLNKAIADADGMTSPFNWGPSIPTHEEVTRLEKNVRNECIEDINSTCFGADTGTSVDALLTALTLDDVNSISPSEAIWSGEVNESGFKGLPPAARTQDYVITSAERRRLYNHPDPILESTTMENDEEIDLPFKRPKYELPDPSQQDNPADEVLMRPYRTVHFQDNDEVFEIDQSGDYLERRATT